MEFNRREEIDLASLVFQIYSTRGIAMKALRLCVVLLATAWAGTAAAEIVETMHFDTLKEYVDNETLIVLDIDNTLLETKQALGSDQWFYHHFKDYIAQGMSSEEALERALPEWEAIQNLTDVQLVEPGTAQTVAALQEKGYTVIGLTTRGLGMSKLAVQQLKKLGINLVTTAPTKEQVFFINEHEMYPNDPHGVIFHQGILFTSGSHKGHAFSTLLEKLDLHPKKVVFINDKASHLKPVEEACVAKGIPFVGLRYGATDARVKGYNHEVGRLQWKAFGQILSDEVAASRLTGAL